MKDPRKQADAALARLNAVPNKLGEYGAGD